MVGGLYAFMMLSGRVAQPLVGLARRVEEYEEVNAAIGEAGVLNRPLEIDAASGGLHPKFAGAISFQDVTFTYGGTGAATVNLAVEHGQEALDIGRVAGLDDDIGD
jgi:ATP-binding cassette subfamily B protein